MQAVVRGYHQYSTIWAAATGEMLHCQRETANPRDTFAVAVVRSSSASGLAPCTVGHVPRKISTICSVFIRRGGFIRCRVTGSRRYSQDLPQGGLEIPCLLLFNGTEKDTLKAERLVKAALVTDVVTDVPEYTPKRTKPCTGSDCGLSKIRKLNPLSPEIETLLESSIISGDKLSDLHVNYAQQLLQCQFPHLKGLQSTLFQLKTIKLLPDDKADRLQIVHSRNDHWIVASNMECESSVVNIYDSVYSKPDKNTEEVILNLFNIDSDRIKLNVISEQKQEGSRDCGVFAIAFATAIAYRKDPSHLIFNQVEMRKHLLACFRGREMTLFPTK